MDAAVSRIIDALKTRDEKRETDFAIAQHELQLKLASQTEVFASLQKLCEKSANEISIALFRPAVRLQQTTKLGRAEIESFALIGEGPECKVEVNCAKDGRIVYSSNLVGEGRNSFNPAVQNGNQVVWFSMGSIVNPNEMRDLLLSIVTQLK